MRGSIARWLVAIAPILLFAERATAEQPASVDEDVYAFMPHFVLDTKRGVFLNGKRGMNYPLENCSTREEVCLKSSEFEFSFPASCAAREAFFATTAAGNRPRVSALKRRHHFSERVHLIIDDDHPSYGLLVGRSGVLAIIYSPLTPVKEVATETSLANAMTGKVVNFTYGEILSAVRMGKCYN